MTSRPDLPKRRPGAAGRWLVVLGLGALPGLLAGSLLTGLVFFLNPHLSFAPAPVARGALGYGVPLAAFSALVTAVAARGSTARARRLLPWSLTVVLTLGAVAAWLNASHYSYFLPPGIDVRLIKAAVLLSLAALVAFYTALLHTLHHRPYGPRSRVGLVLVALASIYFMLERREAYEQVTPPSTPLPSAIGTLPRQRLYVIALDGATLDAILPLAEQGQLPFFARQIASGVLGRLRPFTPLRERALWTSVATGKLPFRHGVVGDTFFRGGLLGAEAELELLPEGMLFRRWALTGARPSPLDGERRRSMALWEILARIGRPTGTIDWPASQPSRESLRFAFSDRFFAGVRPAAEAQPEDLVERGVLFEVEQLDLGDPLVGGVGLEAGDLAALRTLAGDRWREQLAGFLMAQNPDLQALFLRLPGLASVSAEEFGAFAAVAFDASRRKADRAGARRVTAYYRHLDRYLASLLDRDPEPKLVAIVSAYGFEASRGLRRLAAATTGSRRAGRWRHGAEGFALFAGGGFRRGAAVGTLEAIDVAPTLLYALGLPAARDLDGRLVAEAFESEYLASQPLAFVPSYERLRGPSSGPSGSVVRP